MKDLDKTVAELTNLKGDLIKKGIAHRDAVKKILTPEQMLIWENRVRRHLDKGAKGSRNRGMRDGDRPMNERRKN